MTPYYTDIRHMCIPLQQHLLIFIDLTAYFLLLPVLLAVFTSLPQNFIVNLSKGIYLIPFVTLTIPPPNISTAGSYASDTMAPLEMFWMCCFYLFFSPPSFPVNSHRHCFDVGETHFIWLSAVTHGHPQRHAFFICQRSFHIRRGGGDFQSTFENPSENGSPDILLYSHDFYFFCFILLGLKHYWGVQHFQILIIDLVFGAGRGWFFQYLQLCDQSDQKCPEVSTIKLHLICWWTCTHSFLFCFVFFKVHRFLPLVSLALFFCHYTTIKPCGWLATVQEVWCLNQ